MELELLSLAYPPLIVFVAALLVLVLPRIAGFAVGALSLAAVLAISLVAPKASTSPGPSSGSKSSRSTSTTSLEWSASASAFGRL